MNKDNDAKAVGAVAEGWKLVPVEPTEDMVIRGFESRPDPVFQPEHWDAYEQMSGCQQSAFAARLCYAAMLAAAPPAPVQPAVQGWMPIETASKDCVFRDGGHQYGPHILLSDGWSVVRGRWWEHEGGASNFLQDGGRAYFPSTWQPLPSPPTSKQKEQENG
ncbi:hypothetical protein [Massilia endophytica]|uniref:hypothetical protein n=1 Tax=Massilia endophytica TaxID=2899220 RepID=UPI001E491C6F|nr:hypothetical protein [Massilia endophytica]UGQ44940.1 hypothetical protein LSQ66_14150 [Massilia endophytica]